MIKDQASKEYIAQNLAERCDSTLQQGVFLEKTLNLLNEDNSYPFSFKKQYIIKIDKCPLSKGGFKVKEAVGMLERD